MIFLKVRNGLGNQLFVYAFGEYLKLKNPNQIIKYDLTELPDRIDNRVTRDISEIFDYSPNIASIDDIKKYQGRYLVKDFRSEDNLSIMNRIFKKLSSLRFRHDIVVVKEPTFWNIPDSFVHSIINMKIDDYTDYAFDGFWENINYVLPIRNELVRKFSFRKSLKSYDHIFELISKTNSISVHIRRGDYVKISSSYSLPRENYMMCGEEYYHEAFKIIENEVDNPFFVFFSDDTEYVENTYKNISNKFVVSGLKDYEDMQLMSICKHHILANSTFSFWSAFLGNSNGVVIAPKYHYIRYEKNGCKYKKEFFNMPGWKLLE